MGWTMLYLFLGLKIPMLLLAWIVWWAVHAEPDHSEEDARDDGGIGKRPHAPPRLPRNPRRGPHGDPLPPAPPRVRPARAKSRQLTP